MNHCPATSRKYRPQIFGEVYGQKEIVTTLKNAVRLHRLSHAYLFCGPHGTGKTTLARLFAKAINCCSLNADHEPCNQCISCREITQSSSLDVLEIDGASNRGIDDIKELNEGVGFVSSASPYKVYIIDEVHMLTKEAFNALLKTLEEPPSHVLFLLATTEPDKVLPTILSRCQRFYLRRMTREAIAHKLHKISEDLKRKTSPEAIHLIAKHAQGSLRDAESILDQIYCFHDDIVTGQQVTDLLGVVPHDEFFSFDQAVMEERYGYVFSWVHQLFKEGKNLSLFFEGLIEHYRNLAIVKFDSTQISTHPELEERREAYQKSAEQYTQTQLLTIIDYLGESAHRVHQSPFKRMHVEVVLLHIIRSMKQMTIDHLVEELKILKKEIEQKEEEGPQKREGNKKRGEEQKKAQGTVDQRLHDSISTDQEGGNSPLLKKRKRDRLLYFAKAEFSGQFVHKPLRE